MKNFVVRMLSTLVLGFGVLPMSAIAVNTETVATVKTGMPGKTSASDFSILRGKWVRPDGGYTITIRDIEAEGKLDAAYANPGQLPFAQAKASLGDNAIEVFLELRAGGYNGSTYNLTYDPATDILRGVYFQAVAQRKFDVYFERVK
jgi:hypothetical protein